MLAEVDWNAREKWGRKREKKEGQTEHHHCFPLLPPFFSSLKVLQGKGEGGKRRGRGGGGARSRIKIKEKKRKRRRRRRRRNELGSETPHINNNNNNNKKAMLGGAA